MADRSKLVKMRIANFGCFGPEGVEISLDNIVCLVGDEETGDLDAAAQMLGNTSPDTVRVYAKQRKGALTKLARQRWERSTSHLALSQMVAVREATQ